MLLVNCILSIQVEEIKKMKIGDPLDRSTDHGPQNHRAHLEKLLQYCETGVKEGATLVYGGRQVQRPGKSPSGERLPDGSHPTPKPEQMATPSVSEPFLH